MYGGIVDAVIAMGKPVNPDLECREIASPVPVVAIVGKNNPLSTREALTLDDLVKATVATPNDLRHGYSSLLSAMREKGLSPNFKNIIETESAHRDFLNEGGIIFAFSNASLLNDAFGAKAVPLHPDVTFDCPLYLIFNSEINNSPLPLLADYLEVS